ncbi:LCP family protein [Cohnella sp. GbtcB17]|uniref:LCP family protein n=1 Tax=Cohnella sp. GbtcB17 TaxID=2824762 RepID=UPI001C30D27D|nr:LCP family protein [Cohnella sp. GbtcB17]
MDTPEKNRTWVRKTLKYAGIVVGALVVIVGSYAGYLVYKANHAINLMAGDEPVPSPSPSASASGAAGGQQEDADYASDSTLIKKPVTFLLAGIDRREGSGGTLNTDVLMLGSLNPQTNSASLISLPRDLQLKPEDLGSHKANYYYAYFYNKDKDTAMENTKEFYSDLFDFPIDYMIMINFDGLRKLVDAVGGVDVDVDMDMRYVDNADGTNIDLKKGYQHLDGAKALDFVRYRKSNRGTGESSDIARNARQQQVLSQLTEKLASFQGMLQWGKVLDLLGKNVQTDIPESILRDYIYNVKEMKPDTLNVLPLESRWESPYIIVKEDDLEQALDALRAEAGIHEPSDLKLADVVGLDPSPDPDDAR